MNGRWERYNSVSRQTDYYNISGSSVTEGHGSSSQTASLSIDGDETLHIDAGFTTLTLKKTTVEEILKMTNEEAHGYYAFNNEVLYFNGNSDSCKYERK